jgi:hypothetical protein
LPDLGVEGYQIDRFILIANRPKDMGGILQ